MNVILDHSETDLVAIHATNHAVHAMVPVLTNALLALMSLLISKMEHAQKIQLVQEVFIKKALHVHLARHIVLIAFLTALATLVLRDFN